MTNQEALDTLQDYSKQIKKLCEEIELAGDTDFLRERYDQIKLSLEQFVFPLRVSSRLNKAPEVVQYFVFPALNEALLEFTFPKGSRLTPELLQQLYSADGQLEYWLHQLRV